MVRAFLSGPSIQLPRFTELLRGEAIRCFNFCRQRIALDSELRCVNPVHDAHANAVDGLEEIAVDKWLATIFEQHKFSLNYQRTIHYSPEISTSLPTDFVRNFCLLFKHLRIHGRPVLLNDSPTGSA